MAANPELRPLGQALGTEALGIDLSKPLDDATFAWIEKAFADHPVLVFRNQNLGAEELAAFGRRFGRPRRIRWSITATRKSRGLVAANVTRRARSTGSGSSARPTGTPIRPMRTICRGWRSCTPRKCRHQKGGTIFANMCAAYDALPDAIKGGSPASPGCTAAATARPASVSMPAARAPARPRIREKARPAVRRHPVTGRPILFVNPLHTNGFDGMTPGRGVAADRGIGGPCDAGTVRLLPPLAGGRRPDVGRVGDDAPRRRRLPPGRTPIMLRTIVYSE